MKLNALFLGVALFVLAGCKYSNQYNTINADNKFSVSVPDWLKKDEQLKPGAQFQYSNRFRNIYVIGETLSATKPLAELNTEVITPTRLALVNPVVSDSVNVEMNGLKGVRTELFGKMEGENIYYSHLLLADKNEVIHICLWTRTEERKLKYKDDIEKILGSVKAL